MSYKSTILKEETTLRQNKVPEGAMIILEAEYQNQYLPMGVQPSMIKRPAEDAGVVDDLEPEAKRRAVAAAQQDVSELKVPWVGLRSATAGDKGMRRQMEDETLICGSLREQVSSLSQERDFAVFAVLDGHGGKQVAGFVKMYLAAELGTAMAAEDPENKEKPLSDKRIKRCVEMAFQRIDARIASELAGAFDGCCANVLLINKETVFCINLGDSASYLCRLPDSGDQQAIPLQMRQHKCWMIKEKERILRSGGAVENGRINGVLEVSRAFGDISLKKFGVLSTPEYMKFKIDRTKDQFLIMGCDGFWGNWTAVEALELASETLVTEKGRAEREGNAVDLKGVCTELVQHVIDEKKSQDNVTVLIINFEGDQN
jgi:integrin-linked kinase-associated serine/threonine phosphatase 2C